MAQVGKEEAEGWFSSQHHFLVAALFTVILLSQSLDLPTRQALDLLAREQ